MSPAAIGLFPALAGPWLCHPWAPLLCLSSWKLFYSHHSFLSGASSLYCWKCLYLSLIRAPVKHLPPPFVFHCPREGKIYYEHHFTQTSQMCWDSTTRGAISLASALHPRVMKDTRIECSALWGCCFLSWLATNLLCNLKTVATCLWASSLPSMQWKVRDGL